MADHDVRSSLQVIMDKEDKEGEASCVENRPVNCQTSTIDRHPKYEDGVLKIQTPFPEPKIRCPWYSECGYSVLTWNTDGSNSINKLLQHLREVHPDKNVESRQYYCWADGCKKIVNPRHNCKKGPRIRVVEGVQLKCEVCGLKFEKRYALTRHRTMKKCDDTKGVTVLLQSSCKRKKENLKAYKPTRKKRKAADSDLDDYDGDLTLAKEMKLLEQEEVGNVIGDSEACFEDTDDEDTNMDVDEGLVRPEPEEVVDVNNLDDLKSREDKEVYHELVSQKIKECRAKLKILTARKLHPSRWRFTEEIVEEITSLAQKYCDVDPNWKREAKYSCRKNVKMSELRGLYDNNNSAGYRVVQGQDVIVCSIEVSVVEKFWSLKYGEDKEHEKIDKSYFDIFKSIASETGSGQAETSTGKISVGDIVEADCLSYNVSVKMSKFTMKEVLVRLKGFKNTAPGLDKLQYRHLEMFDPEGEILTSIFNLCITRRMIPNAWKKSKTLLFPKNGESSDPADWRNICLLPTMYKVLSGVLADRLKLWCFGDTKIHIHPSQKGAGEFDMVLEHGYMLDYAIRATKKDFKNSYFAFLDLKAAFISVPISAVIDVLNAKGAGFSFTQMVKNILSDQQTEIIVKDGTTNPIKIERGLITGDPLSMLLFLLVLDGTLLKVNTLGPSFHFLKYNTLAGVDDIVAMADTPEQLQEVVCMLEESLKKIHLSFNSDKCIVLPILHKRGYDKSKVINIRVNGKMIPCLKDGEYHTFLGIQYGYKKPVPTPLLGKYERKINRLFSSELSGKQKLHAFVQYIVPEISHDIRVGKYAIGKWKELEVYIRPLLKQALGLKWYGPAEYLYGAKKFACMGINNIVDDFMIGKIVNAYKILTSPDKEIQTVALNDLARITGTVYERNDVKRVDALLGYLNRKYEFTSYQSIWSQARTSSATMNVEWGVDSGRNVTLKMNGVHIDLSDKRYVMRNLRLNHRVKIAQDYLNTKYSAVSLLSFSRSRFSMYFLSGRCDSKDWHFIHAARTQMTHVANSMAMIKVKQDNGTAHSRFCRYKEEDQRDPDPYETVEHVLSGCKHNMEYIKQRHNCIQDMLVVKLKEYHFEIVSIDNIMNVPDNTKRPDIVASRGRNVYVIDVACPSDYKFYNVRNSGYKKEKKYTDLANEWLELNRDNYDTVKVYPFIIGCRGAYDDKNDELMEIIFRNDHRSRKQFSANCVRMVVKWSRCIMERHLHCKEIVVEDGYPDTKNRTDVKQVPNPLCFAGDEK